MGRPVRETVTIHPESVERAHSLARKKRKPRVRKSDPPVRRYYKKKPDFVDKAVWARAWSLAGGDYKRLVVESTGSVLVVNHG